MAQEAAVAEAVRRRSRWRVLAARLRAAVGRVARHPVYATSVALGVLRRPRLVREALRRGWRAALLGEAVRRCPAAGDLISAYEAGFFGQVYLFDEYEVARLPLPPRPTVLDVGANVGFFSWRAAEARPGARILAFEPESGNHARLAALLHALGIAAETPRCAVGARAGAATLYLRNSVTHSLQADWHRDLDAGAGTERVDVTTVDAECARRGIEAIDLLKIDTEGAEADVLAGAVEMLPRTAHVVLEYHSPERRDACLALLRAAGFRCRHKAFWGLGAAGGAEGLLLCRRAGPRAGAAAARPNG